MESIFEFMNVIVFLYKFIRFPFFFVCLLIDPYICRLCGCYFVLYSCIYTFYEYLLLFVLMQWLESEVVRLSHLRDRASEKGRRKEYPFAYIFLCIFSFEMSL